MKKLLLFLFLFFNIYPKFMGTSTYATSIIREENPPYKRKTELVIFNAEECTKTGIKPLELQNNEVLMPQYDGLNYFIDADGMRPTEEDKASPLKIQKAVDEATKNNSIYPITNISDIVNGLSGLDFKKLPIVLDIKGTDESKNIKIVILSIVFSQTETIAQAGILTMLPNSPQFQDENGSQQQLYLGSQLTLKKGGAMGGSFALIAPKTINFFNLQGYAKVSLSVGTGICLGCSARKNAKPSDLLFFLSGAVELAPAVAVAETVEGEVKMGADGYPAVPKLLFSVELESWSGLKLTATLPPDYGVRLTQLPFIGFRADPNKPFSNGASKERVESEFLCTSSGEKLGSNIIYDFSEEGTIINGKKVQGLILENLIVRLPKQLKDSKDKVVSVGVQYFYVDEGGVSASVSSIQKPGDGYLINPKIEGIFDLGVKNVLIKIDEGKLTDYNISGDLELPIISNYDLSFTLGKSGDILNFGAGIKNGQKAVKFNLFGVKVELGKPNEAAKPILKPVEGFGKINLLTGALESFGVSFNQGNFSILDGTSKSLGFYFDQLTLITAKPYLKDFTLFPLKDRASTVAGFNFGFDSFQIHGDPETGKIKGTVDVFFDLITGRKLEKPTEEDKSKVSNQAISADAIFAFDAETKTKEGKEKFEFGKFDLTGIHVTANFPAFGFDGMIKTFSDEDRLGVPKLSGFEGKVAFWFNFMSDADKDPKTGKNGKESQVGTGAGVYVLFAKNQQKETAWAVDVAVKFDPGIVLGTATLKGVFGGAYSNLKVIGDPTTKVSSDAMGSRTGLTYGWETGKWGFNFGLDITASATVDVSAMLAVEGKVGEGLSFIKAAGYAKFKLSLEDLLPGIGDKLEKNLKKVASTVNSIPGDISPSLANLKTFSNTEQIAKGTKEDGSDSFASMFNKTPVDNGPNRIAAGLVIALNFKNGGINELSVKMYPDVYIDFKTSLANTSLNSHGYGMLYISPDKKYLHLGNSKTLGDRLGLDFTVSAGNSAAYLSLNASVNAYFMLGDDIPVELPDPVVPMAFLSQFKSKQGDIKSQGKDTKFQGGSDPAVALREGSGLAFGAAVGVSLKLGIAYVFDVEAGVGAGFDALLLNDNGCSPTGESAGWGNSSGSSKSWRAAAQIYGYANAKVEFLTISLAEFGVGFLLKASIPKPLYAEGYFNAYLKIWVAEMNFRIHGKIGEGCVDATSTPMVQKVQMIENLIPNPTTKISTIGNMFVKRVFPKDQVLAGLKEGTRTFDQEVRITIVGGKADGTDLVFSKNGIQANKNVNELVKMVIPSKLIKNKTYTAKVYTRVYPIANYKEGRPGDKTFCLVNSGETLSYFNKNEETGDYDKTIFEDEKTYSFTTSEADFELQEPDLLVYPAKGQYNVYKGDYTGKGYLVLDTDIATKIQQNCTDCNVRMGFYQAGNLQGTTTPINLSTPELNFDLTAFQPDKIYEMRILATVDGQENTLYKSHYFRVSQYDTFTGKVSALITDKNVEWNPYDLNFTISSNTVNPNELFSEDEIKTILSINAKTGAGTWFSETRTALEAIAMTDGTKPLLTGVPTWWFGSSVCKQAQHPFLKNDQTDNVQSADKNSFASPTFLFDPFQTTMLDVVRLVYYYALENRDEITADNALKLLHNTDLCMDLKYKIKELPYYKSHYGLQLTPRFDEIQTDYCFKYPGTIDFLELSKQEQTVIVKCTKGAFDSKPLQYSFEYKNKSAVLSPMPKNVSIACSGIFVGGIETIKADAFTNIQDFELINGVPKALIYASNRKSSAGCPVVEKFSSSSSASLVKTKFELQTFEEAPVKPCLTIKAYTKEYYAEECRRACGNTTECNSICDGLNAVTTDGIYLIESWENSFRSSTQVVRNPLKIKLSNGKEVNFPSGEKSYAIIVDEADLKGLNGKPLSIIVNDNSDYVCGENLGDIKVLMPSIVSTGNGTSIQEACVSTESITLFCADKIDNVVLNKSVFLSAIEPNKVIPDKNFYAFGSGDNKEVFVLNGGTLTAKYFCGSNPSMLVSCKSAERNFYGDKKITVTLTLKFFSKLATGEIRPEFPWYIPETGLLIGNYVIPKESIKSSTQEIEYFSGFAGNENTNKAVAFCSNINSETVTPIPGIQITSPPKGDCAVKPSAPTLTSSIATESAKYGERVNISATGCTGTVLWADGNETSASIARVITKSSTFIGQCINATTNCLSPQTSITINVKPLSIEANQNYICEGQSLNLTASGCGATPIWSSDDTGLDMTRATGMSFSIIPTKDTKFTFKCKVDETHIQTVERSFAFYGVVAKPIIDHNIPLVQNKTICSGELVTLTATACETKKTLEWSNGATTALISINPTQNVSVYAVCKDEYCYSLQSNTIDIVAVSMKKTVIDSRGALNKTVCVSDNFTLFENNCEGTDQVRWFKKGQTSHFKIGTDISTNIGVATTFIAKCYRKISSDDSKWCEGANSNEITIQAIAPSDLAVNLAIGKNAICAYESTTLTATGCTYGIVEWSMPNNSTWTALSNNAKTYNTTLAGTYKVRCNLNNSCYNVEHTSGNDIKQTLTVNPEPQTPILITDKSNHTICAGNSIGLSGTCISSTLQWIDLTSNPITLSNSQSFYATCNSTVGCVSQIKGKIDIIVNPIPQKLTINSSVGSQMCEYDATTITANGCGEKVIWKDNTTVNPIIDFKRNQGEYYFAAKCEEKGCVGVFSNDFKLTVYDRPAKPSISVSKASVCYGQETILLSVTGCDVAGSSVKWNDNDVSRTKTLSEVGNYEYSVKCILNNCESNVSETAKVTVLATPTVPQISSSNGWSICEYNPTTITTGCSVASNPIWSNSTLINVSHSGDYKVYCQGDNGCRSADSELKKLIVYNRPPKPSISITNDNICQGYGTLSMSVSGCTNASIKWNDGDVSATKSLTNTGTYKYRVQCIQNNCESEWSEYAEGNVLFTPNKPSISGATSICDGANTNITATCENSTLVWTNAPAAIGSVGTYTYTATCESTGCKSASNSFIQTVYSYPAEPVIEEDRLCGKTILTVNNCGGSISWSNGGNTKSIEITSKGSYTAYCNSNGCTTQKTINTSDVKVSPSAPSISTSDNETGTIYVCNNDSKLLGADGLVNWYKNGVKVWTKSNLEGANEGTYKALRYSDGCNSEFSNEIIIKSLSISEPSTIVEEKYCGYTFLKSSCASGTPNWSNNSTSSEYRIETAGAYSLKCNNSNICISSPVGITITSIKNTPAVPTVSLAQNSTLSPCNGETLMIYTSGGTNSTEWYKDGNFFSNGAELSLWFLSVNVSFINNLENGTYKVRRVVEGCYSGFSDEMSVNHVYATKPNISVSTVNCQNQVTLTNTCESSVKWYNASNSLLSNANSYTSQNSNSVYAKCENGGCISEKSNSVSFNAINYNENWQDVANSANCTSNLSVTTCTKIQKDMNPCSESANDTRTVTTNTCSEILTVSFDATGNGGAGAFRVGSPLGGCVEEIKWYYTGNGSKEELLQSSGYNLNAYKGKGMYQAKCKNSCGSVSQGTGYAY
jgi:hypothetical protein